MSATRQLGWVPVGHLNPPWGRGTLETELHQIGGRSGLLHSGDRFASRDHSRIVEVTFSSGTSDSRTDSEQRQLNAAKQHPLRPILDAWITGQPGGPDSLGLRAAAKVRSYSSACCSFAALTSPAAVRPSTIRRQALATSGRIVCSVRSRPSHSARNQQLLATAS